MIKSLPVFIFAIIVLALGVAMLVHRLKQLKNNTATTQATLVDYEEEVHSDSDGDDTVVYYPVYRYSVNGTEYTKRDSFGSGSKSASIGSEVVINYNPNKPEDFNVSNNVFSWILPAIICTVGLVLTIAMINF